MENNILIDNYILTFSPDIQSKLNELRKVIQEASPNAAEKISYGMPTFELHGNLVHFAAFKNHIGFYPTPSGIDMFKEELSAYKMSKGAVQFPIDRPLPYELIARIVKFRTEENRKKHEAKKK